MEWQEKKKKFPLLPRVTGGTESVLPVPAGPAGQSERCGVKGKAKPSRAQVGSGYLRPGLVSVSVVLVLGVLTLDYRIKVKSVNRKRVSLKYSDAGNGVLLHHEIGKRNSKSRKHKSVRRVRGNRNCRKERESGCTYVCGMSVEQNTRGRTGKMELLYT